MESLTSWKCFNEGFKITKFQNIKYESYFVSMSILNFNLYKLYLLVFSFDIFDLCQAGELEILSAVLKWGEHQLVKRMEERGTHCYSKY